METQNRITAGNLQQRALSNLKEIKEIIEDSLKSSSDEKFQQEILNILSSMVQQNNSTTEGASDENDIINQMEKTTQAYKTIDENLPILEQLNTYIKLHKYIMGNIIDKSSVSSLVNNPENIHNYREGDSASFGMPKYDCLLWMQDKLKSMVAQSENENIKNNMMNNIDSALENFNKLSNLVNKQQAKIKEAKLKEIQPSQKECSLIWKLLYITWGMWVSSRFLARNPSENIVSLLSRDIFFTTSVVSYLTMVGCELIDIAYRICNYARQSLDGSSPIEEQIIKTENELLQNIEMLQKHFLTLEEEYVNKINKINNNDNKENKSSHNNILQENLKQNHDQRVSMLKDLAKSRQKSADILLNLYLAMHAQCKTNCAYIDEANSKDVLKLLELELRNAQSSKNTNDDSMQYSQDTIEQLERYIKLHKFILKEDVNSSLSSFKKSGICSVDASKILPSTSTLNNMLVSLTYIINEQSLQSKQDFNTLKEAWQGLIKLSKKMHKNSHQVEIYNAKEQAGYNILWVGTYISWACVVAAHIVKNASYADRNDSLAIFFVVSTGSLLAACIMQTVKLFCAPVKEFMPLTLNKEGEMPSDSTKGQDSDYDDTIRNIKTIQNIFIKLEKQFLKQHNKDKGVKYKQ